ncbi:MAG: protein kinase [Lachnospiraceae bacterium]|nr:protein kinase [Lachnospiraceae bacterium]
MSNYKQKVNFNGYSAVDNTINSDNVLLLKNNENQYFVQKIVPIYQKEIYDYLIVSPIMHTPKIYEIKNMIDYLIVLCEYIDGNTLTDYLNNLFLQKQYDLNKNIIFKNFYKHIYTLLNIIQNLQKSKIIIHRDIKPDNIIINKNKELYLIDFDASKIYSNDTKKDTHPLISDGYSAPEQYGFGSSNKSTDIYAIGKVINDYIDIIDDKKLTKKIFPIVDKCCKIDYKDRYKSINHLKLDLFRAEHNIMFLAIPGFRSSNPFHIIVATFFYLFLLYVCFKNTYINILPLNICIFISALTFIFLFFNYLDVHRFLPFTKSKNPILKYLSITLYSCIISFAIIFCFIVFYK